MHNYEDNAKFHSSFSATTLSYASRFRRKRGVIENLEYLGEFEKDFRKMLAVLRFVSIND
jgi:hypothetical protein